jgi:UDP-glucuronate 4-epimerase
MNKVLVTGAAGFIGFHTTIKLLQNDLIIFGLDSINDYYDVNLKYSRLALNGVEKEKIEYGKTVQSNVYANYRFMQLKLEDKDELTKLFEKEQFDVVVNLGAQAGVGYSIHNPQAYINSNIFGFLNILECCRHFAIKHLIYASTSSVYGLNQKMPLVETDSVNHPLTLYSASKKSNELMAHSYSHLFELPTTGLRFFTVYGTWGRPDMALFLFTNAMLKNEPIKIFNNGEMARDFTYVDDITESILRLLNKPPQSNAGWNAVSPDPSTSSAPYRILNIGNSIPISIMKYVEVLEKKIGKEAIKQFEPMRQGDIKETHASHIALENLIHFKPQVNIETGVGKFVDWYRGYYKI